MNALYEVRNGYVYVKAMGEFDPSATRDIFFALVEHAHSNALNRILCDITLITKFDIQYTSPLTRFDIGRFVAKSLPKKVKLAVLETPQQLTGIRFSEHVVINREGRVKLTSNLNEALEWLGVTSTKKADVSDSK